MLTDEQAKKILAWNPQLKRCLAGEMATAFVRDFLCYADDPNFPMREFHRRAKEVLKCVRT